MKNNEFDKLVEAFGLESIVEVIKEKTEELTSDIKPYFLPKKRHQLLLNYRAKLYKDKDELMRNSVSRNEECEWFYDFLIEEMEAKIKRFNTAITKLEISMGLIKPSKNYFNVDQIKQSVSILELFTPKQKYNQYDRIKCLCPFHEEKTPSFTIYKNSNTFYCFGCGQAGDAISFYMKLNDCDFKIACQELSKLACV